MVASLNNELIIINGCLTLFIIIFIVYILILYAETLNEDSNKKRTRGKSCGKGLHEYVEANGGKRVTLPFNSILQVPINRIMSGKFTTEVGCIVRSHAPVCHDGWKKVPETDKKKLREALLVTL